jgi:hypothetical protein
MTCPAAAGGCGVWVGSAVAGNASLTNVGVAVAPADSLAGVVTGVGVARGGVRVGSGDPTGVVTWVGVAVGVGVGVGVTVGTGVPTGVVTWVGVAVGSGVGVAVGSGVGVAVGSGVGVAVGSGVGVAVGSGVGVAVGSGVPTGVAISGGVTTTVLTRVGIAIGVSISLTMVAVGSGVPTGVAISGGVTTTVLTRVGIAIGVSISLMMVAVGSGVPTGVAISVGSELSATASPDPSASAKLATRSARLRKVATQVIVLRGFSFWFVCRFIAVPLSLECIATRYPLLAGVHRHAVSLAPCLLSLPRKHAPGRVIPAGCATGSTLPTGAHHSGSASSPPGSRSVRRFRRSFVPRSILVLAYAIG